MSLSEEAPLSVVMNLTKAYESYTVREYPDILSMPMNSAGSFADVQLIIQRNCAFCDNAKSHKMKVWQRVFFERPPVHAESPWLQEDPGLMTLVFRCLLEDA